MKKATPEQIREDRWTSQNPYAHLDGEGGFSAILQQHAEDQESRINIDEIRDHQIVGTQISFEKIEEITKSLQIKLWKLKEPAQNDPIALLNPAAVFKSIGYQFEGELYT